MNSLILIILIHLLLQKLMLFVIAWQWGFSDPASQCAPVEMGIVQGSLPTDGSAPYHLLFVPTSLWTPQISVFQMNFTDPAGNYKWSAQVNWPTNTNFVVVVSIMTWVDSHDHKPDYMVGQRCSWIWDWWHQHSAGCALLKQYVLSVQKSGRFPVGSVGVWWDTMRDFEHQLEH